MNKSTSPRQVRRRRIKMRIHKRIVGTPERPRLVVYRSLKQIYAQVVDDSQSRTLFTVSSLGKEIKAKVAEALKAEAGKAEAGKAKGKTDVAKLVGKAAGEEAKKRNITSVVFDRNGYLYHGRVKAVADGAREAGLIF
jgi:large subunit ribosomal protein L18